MMHGTPCRMDRLHLRLAIFLLLLLLPVGRARAAAATTEELAVRAAAESILRRYASQAMLYEPADLRAGTVLDPSVDPAPILEEEGEKRLYHLGGKEYSMDQLRENILYLEKKAFFYASMRQLQNIYRQDLTLQYTCKELEIEANTARVYITETALFRYTDTLELQTVNETNYTVRLIRRDGQWLAANVSDGSLFDKQYKAQGASLDESAVLAAFTASLAQDGCTLAFPYEPSGGADRILYDGESAAAYAATWARPEADTSRSDFYSPRFARYDGSGGDCMNFASQSMWAGFGGSQTAEAVSSRALPMDTIGDGQWYALAPRDTSKIGLSWVSCQSFRQYLTGQRDGGGTGGSNAAGEAGMYATILDAEAGSGFSCVTAEELVGAVAHVEGSGGAYSHAIVFTAAAGTARGQILFSGHTKDVTNVKLGDCYIGPMKVYIPRYIRTGGAQADFLRAQLLRPVQPGETGLLTAQAGGVRQLVSISVTTPNGIIELAASAEDSDSCQAEYEFTKPGLYRITCCALAAERGAPETYAYYVRCLAPSVPETETFPAVSVDRPRVDEMPERLQMKER